MNPVELTLQTPTLRLAARAWGSPEGRPVLALHGWLDNAASFDRLIPHLPDDLYVVALDQAGHGHSQHRPRGTPYLFPFYVGEVFAAADALGWTRFSLLGHSMGAAVSCLSAGTFPERIERTALIEGLGPWSNPDARAPANLAAALSRRPEMLAHEPRIYERTEAITRLQASRKGLTEAGAEALAARAVEAVEGQPGKVRFRHDPMLRAPSLWRLTEAQVTAFLQRMTQPTALVMARDGWPHDEAIYRERAAAVPELETFEVDGCHHLHLDDPEPVARLVGRHLNASSQT